MRKFSLSLLAGVLVAAALTAPSLAKDKGLTLYLRWDGPDCGATYLSPEDAPDDGNGCAFTFQAAQEVLTVAGLGPLAHEWPGPLDKPAKLAAGEVKGAFMVKAYGAAGATLEVKLTAVTKKGSETIGEYVSDPLVTYFTGSVPVDFALEVPKKLVGQKVLSLNLTTTFRGMSVQSYIELDSPAATITLPTK